MKSQLINTRHQRIHTGIISVVAVFLFVASIDKPPPKILIIGDSISGGYTPFVIDYFKDLAIVEHNPGNAKHSGYGLDNVKDWVGNDEWDRHPDSELYGNRDKVNGNITFSIDKYKANLDSILTVLNKISDAKLIFITTTYVPENEQGRYTKDVKKYNKAAKAVMKKHSVLVNDIYKESVVIHKENGVGSDDVHYTDKGYKQMSKLIIDYQGRLAIRQGYWKLIDDELYNLADDIKEEKNVAEEYPEIVEELKILLEKQQTDGYTVKR
jgi:lysophospholipase L1-like esterase